MALPKDAILLMVWFKPDSTKTWWSSLRFLLWNAAYWFKFVFLQ